MNWRWLPFLVLLMVLSGCYHLRISAEPLNPVSLSVSGDAAEILPAVRGVIERDGFFIAEDGCDGMTILTAYRHFQTETGFGQPVGGRDYFYRLRVTVLQEAHGSKILLEPVQLEMRTSYVYDEDGKVQTLRKRYPYEHYPGMFDLDFVTAELDRVRVLVGTAMAEKAE